MRPLGPARAVLNLLDPPHVLVLSERILDEVRRVLIYDRLQKQAPLTPEQIEKFVTALAQQADLVLLQEPIPQASPDPDDDVVLATAVQGKSGVVCTRDHHLLNENVKSYAALHGIRILTDLEVIAELRPPPAG